MFPYHLREYNNRWFLFGRNKDYLTLTNLAPDRILSIADGKHPYIENTEWDFNEYFEDIVGVSFESNQVEKIRLLVRTQGTRRADSTLFYF
ncbi:WYL domain-containing protein [Sphingobacterium sp. SGG-5]|uniref:WYL domain-containing protein n=1 Tax=Sphingobacterium sp. SGG-5 TaxID=2710881 RepID=UPI00293BBB64|nr:WYL domain-containing protein [Sphingobacterium sp. SGG-5]